MAREGSRRDLEQVKAEAGRTITTLEAELDQAKARQEALEGEARVGRDTREAAERCKQLELDLLEYKHRLATARASSERAEAPERERGALVKKISALEAELGSLRSDKDSLLQRCGYLEAQREWAEKQLEKLTAMFDKSLAPVKSEVGSQAGCSSSESCLLKHLTCGYCLGTLRDAVSLVPCGHTFCRECVAKAMLRGYRGGTVKGLCCVTCGESSVVLTAFDNLAIREVVAACGGLVDN